MISPEEKLWKGGEEGRGSWWRPRLLTFVSVGVKVSEERAGYVQWSLEKIQQLVWGCLANHLTREGQRLQNEEGTDYKWKGWPAPPGLEIKFPQYIFWSVCQLLIAIWGLGELNDSSGSTVEQ